MRRISFAELPWIARIVLGMAALNFWVSFEEFVVDRVGLWRYMPAYKVGRFCIWDLTVTTGIALIIWRLSARTLSKDPSGK